VLALMALPTVIIATRSSLKAVPPSIREAALAVGASKDPDRLPAHVLPLAMPGRDDRRHHLDGPCARRNRPAA
jgi:phosphate transport system permease protein